MRVFADRLPHPLAASEVRLTREVVERIVATRDRFHLHHRIRWQTWPAAVPPARIGTPARGSHSSEKALQGYTLCIQLGFERRPIEEANALWCTLAIGMQRRETSAHAADDWTKASPNRELRGLALVPSLNRASVALCTLFASGTHGPLFRTAWRTREPTVPSL